MTISEEQEDAAVRQLDIDQLAWAGRSPPCFWANLSGSLTWWPFVPCIGSLLSGERGTRAERPLSTPYITVSAQEGFDQSRRACRGWQWSGKGRGRKSCFAQPNGDRQRYTSGRGSLTSRPASRHRLRQSTMESSRQGRRIVISLHP